MKETKLYPAKTKRARWIERKQGTFVLNEKTGKYHKLNDTASLVWQLSNGIKTIEEISNIVEKEYDVGPDKAKKDTCDIINCLRSVGVIDLFKNSKKFYPHKIEP